MRAMTFIQPKIIKQIKGCKPTDNKEQRQSPSNLDTGIIKLLKFNQEIQPVHSEGDQPWDFFGRNDAKAETPVLWPPHAKN